MSVPLSTEQSLYKLLEAWLSGTGEVGIKEWEYLGGTYIANPDDQAVTYISGTEIIVLEVESGPCYYQINGSYADAASYGYVPQDGMRSIGPLSNLQGFHIHGPTCKAHIQFWK